MNEEKKNLTEEERKELKENLKNQIDEMPDEELDKVAGGAKELGKTYGYADWPVGQTRNTFSVESRTQTIWHIKIVEGNYTLKFFGDWGGKLKYGYKFKISGNENIFTFEGGSSTRSYSEIEIGIPKEKFLTESYNLRNNPNITRVE